MCFEQGRIAVARRQAGIEPLERGAHFDHLARTFQRQLGDARAMPRQHFDHALGGESAQCVAHRHARHTEVRCQAAFDESFARLVAPRQDGAAQFFGNHVAEGRVQRAERGRLRIGRTRRRTGRHSPVALAIRRAQHQVSRRDRRSPPGGIGITPFLSMIRQATHQELPHRLYLFYSNRRPEDAAFLEELRELDNENPNFTLIATMAEMEKSALSWSGETGFITREMVHKAVVDLRTPLFYVAGPPAMVNAMVDMLRGAAADPGSIRAEEFAGY